MFIPYLEYDIPFPVRRPVTGRLILILIFTNFVQIILKKVSSSIPFLQLKLKQFLGIPSRMVFLKIIASETVILLLVRFVHVVHKFSCGTDAIE